MIVLHRTGKPLYGHLMASSSKPAVEMEGDYAHLPQMFSVTQGHVPLALHHLRGLRADGGISAGASLAHRR